MNERKGYVQFLDISGSWFVEKQYLSTFNRFHTIGASNHRLFTSENEYFSQKIKKGTVLLLENGDDSKVIFHIPCFCCERFHFLMQGLILILDE